MEANGTHQIKSLVMIVAPHAQGRLPLIAASRKPMGPKILPRNPTSTMGQCRKGSPSGNPVANPVDTHDHADALPDLWVTRLFHSSPTKNRQGSEDDGRSPDEVVDRRGVEHIFGPSGRRALFPVLHKQFPVRQRSLLFRSAGTAVLQEFLTVLGGVTGAQHSKVLKIVRANWLFSSSETRFSRERILVICSTASGCDIQPTRRCRSRAKWPFGGSAKSKTALEGRLSKLRNR